MSTPLYTSYLTITREQAYARGFDGAWLNAKAGDRSHVYDYGKARELLARCPTATEVQFCRRGHNDCLTRYRPQPGVIVYVKAGSGCGSRTVTMEPIALGATSI